MKAILNDIQTGKFVRDWMLECKVKHQTLRHLVEFQKITK